MASRSLEALGRMSREDAQETLMRLVDGYKDKSGSGYDAAVRTPSGCLIAQKVGNRANEDTSYPQIAPIKENKGRGPNGTHTEKSPPITAGRLIIRAYGTDEAREKILSRGYTASHLCHTSMCIEVR